MTITEFLTARLDEDEAVARQDESPDSPDGDGDIDWEAHIAAGERWEQQPHGRQCGWRLGEGTRNDCECGYPARVLADIAAKRAIVAEYVEAEAYYRTHTDAPAGELTGLGTAIRLLAQPYADHPDFDPAWRVA